jgi:2-hydroxychromene-2-carboxylate isomerase
VQDPRTLAIAGTSLAHRLGRLGIAAAGAGAAGSPLRRGVAGALWDGHRGDDGTRATTWRAPPDAPGSTSAELDRAIAAEPGERGGAGRQRTRRCARPALGVPTAVIRGEPFFGQDRLDTLVSALASTGRTARLGQALQRGT